MKRYKPRPNGSCIDCKCPIYTQHLGKVKRCRRCYLLNRIENPTQSPSWKGGRYFNSAGYVYVFSPNHPLRTKSGYVMEHRLVAEKTIGRFLERGEVVHHINGIPSDNRPENLVVCASSAEHHKDFHPRFTKPKIKKKCSQCGRAAETRGLCRSHYSKWLDARPNVTRKKCDFCDRPMIAKGKCKQHYYDKEYWRKWRETHKKTSD